MWFETRSVKYYSNAPSPFTHTVMFYGRKYNFALDNVFTLEIVNTNNLLGRNLNGINALTPSNASYLNNNLDYKLHFL